MNNKFQENLRKIRKEQNLSQEQLADELGVSRQAISKWESGTAYPEMDKIIQLCEKFNVNMDDLLHKDINEVKGEEETKKNINRNIEEFLKYITDSVNLFINMSFKSKIKFLFEEFVIAFVLFIISSILYRGVYNLIDNIIVFVSPRIKFYILSIISSILVLSLLIVSIVIMAYIFKARYLNYYQRITDKKEETDKEVTEDKSEAKPELKETKIIIRDPKHSEYRFINGILKVIVFFIKLFLLFCAFFLALALMGFGFAFIASFLFYKTGMFFFGLLSISLGCGLITSVILILIINFILNRKGDKRALIIIFILSLALIGVGGGLTFNGSLKFDYINDESKYKVETTEHKMTDTTSIYNNYYTNITNINYIEKDIKNIKVEYKINKYCELRENINKDNSIMGYVDCGPSTNIIKSYLNDINDKKIIPINSEIDSINVYASKENIKKLKDNAAKNKEESEKQTSRIESYRTKISELEEENRNLKQELDSVKRELNKLKPNE